MESSRPVIEPQLKTRIRRWRRYQPTTNIVFDEGDAETARQPLSRPTAPSTRRVGVEFINAAHPRDATSSAAVSSIRSHAARGAHALRRVSALLPSVDAKTRGTQAGNAGASHLAVTGPAHLTILICDGLFQGVRPISKVEHFLLDYCRR